MNQEKINRINELYKKQKAGTITPEEKDEQSLLRFRSPMAPFIN